MPEVKNHICDICEKEQSIAFRNGRGYCSCECWLIEASRQWPAMVSEQTDINAVRKEQAERNHAIRIAK